MQNTCLQKNNTKRWIKRKIKLVAWCAVAYTMYEEVKLIIKYIYGIHMVNNYYIINYNIPSINLHETDGRFQPNLNWSEISDCIQFTANLILVLNIIIFDLS